MSVNNPSKWGPMVSEGEVATAVGGDILSLTWNSRNRSQRLKVAYKIRSPSFTARASCA